MDIQFVWWILHKGRTLKIKRHNNNFLEKYHAKSIVIKNQKELDKFMVCLFDNVASHAK